MASHTVYRGQRVSIVTKPVITNHGEVTEREYVSHPGAVVILPLLTPTTLILIRNHRFAIDQSLWELPAGTLEPNEDLLVCAHRELEEETGYRAKQMTPLLEFFSGPGYCNQKLFVYKAEEMTFFAQQLEPTENITIHEIPLDQALEMIRQNVICDAKTIAVILFYALRKACY